MKYSNLPEYEKLPDTNLISFEQGNLVTLPAPNAIQEISDFQIVQLVLTAISPDNTLASHINDSALHKPINDGVVSTSSTWSSSQIQSSIDGSSQWLTLDNIPEGSNNLYFTEERGLQLISQTTQGIPQVDHEAVATQLASVLLGFNSNTFEYYNIRMDGEVITVDGVDFIDVVQVTPGNHTVSYASSSSITFRCDALGHEVQLEPGTVVFTPELTLDSFKDGVDNKIFTPEALDNTPVIGNIKEHINTRFDEFHAQIRDNVSSSTTSTWSSKKILSHFFSEFNRISNLTSHKELSVMHERASSGGSAGSYSWTTDDNNPTHTHYVKRRTSDDNWNENISTSTDEWDLEAGTWFIYWQVSEDINPYFTNVNNVVTYLALDNDPRTPILEHPGVLTITSRTNYTLVTKFTADQDYSSSYRNTWLVPRSIPNIDELYGIVHIERIR